MKNEKLKFKNAKLKKTTFPLTVCLSPRMRFGLELIARIHRSSLGGAMEYCINNCLSSPAYFLQIMEDTWDIDYFKRLANLEKHDLLSYEEELEFREFLKREEEFKNNIKK